MKIDSKKVKKILIPLFFPFVLSLIAVVLFYDSNYSLLSQLGIGYSLFYSPFSVYLYIIYYGRNSFYSAYDIINIFSFQNIFFFILFQMILDYGLIHFYDNYFKKRKGVFLTYLIPILVNILKIIFLIFVLKRML